MSENKTFNELAHELSIKSRECVDLLDQMDKKEMVLTDAKIGEVIMSADTGNVTIVVTDSFTGKKTERFLVVSEFNELMNPTGECYQNGMKLITGKFNFDTTKKIQRTVHCHRCGWDGDERETLHPDGYWCPKCPEHKDDHASLSVID